MRGRLVCQVFPQSSVMAINEKSNPSEYNGTISRRFSKTNGWARVIHPRASVSPLASIGRNVLIMAGVVITSDAVIGDHVCILPNTVIHHDVTIGDWSLVGANVTVAGGAGLADNCYIGSGSRIMNGVEIGAGALVGLGSNVIRDVRAGATVAGNPAREIH